MLEPITGDTKVQERALSSKDRPKGDTAPHLELWAGEGEEMECSVYLGTWQLLPALWNRLERGNLGVCLLRQVWKLNVIIQLPPSKHMTIF